MPYLTRGLLPFLMMVSYLSWMICLLRLLMRGELMKQ